MNTWSLGRSRYVNCSDSSLHRLGLFPLRFHKIAAWLEDQRLAAAGYVLDQAPLVQPILAAPDRQSRTAPPLGASRTFQVPIADTLQLGGSGRRRLTGDR